MKTFSFTERKNEPYIRRIERLITMKILKKMTKRKKRAIKPKTS